MNIFQRISERLQAQLHFAGRHPEISFVWLIALGFVGLNLASLDRKYDYWSRMYQYLLTVVLWFILGWMGHSLYFELPYAILRRSTDFVSMPVLSMSCVFTVPAMLGSLYFIYFDWIFAKCDRAVRLYTSEQTVADNFYQGTLVFVFPAYLIYIIQRSRVHLEARKMGFIQNHVILASIFLIFIKVGAEEAYHTLEAVCHRRKEVGLSCPKEHNYSCIETEVLSVTQHSWLELHENVLTGAIFLIIAELLPLLFAFHWEISEELEQREDEHINEFAERHGHTERRPELIRHRSIVCTVSAAALVLLLLFRLGFRLKWIAEYPDAFAAEWDNVGECFCFGALFLLFLAIHFGIGPHLVPYCDRHLAHHAYLDKRLLLIACLMTSALYSVRLGLFYGYDIWLTKMQAGIQIFGALFIVCSAWTQFLILRRFLACNQEGLKAIGKFGVLGAVSLAAFNLLTWLSVFAERRFTNYLLSLPSTPFGVVYAAAATEPFAPAISFFYFHCTMCWSVVIYRFLRSGIFALQGPPALDERPRYVSFPNNNV